MTNMAKGPYRQVFENLRQLAGANHDARYSAAITAYEDARIDGLCHDGAWECALAALGANTSEISAASKSAEK